MDDGGDAILDFGFGERRSFSELLFGVTRLKLNKSPNLSHRSSIIPNSRVFVPVCCSQRLDVCRLIVNPRVEEN